MVNNKAMLVLALCGLAGCAPLATTPSASSESPQAPLSLQEMLTCVSRSAPLPAVVAARRAATLEAQLPESGAEGRFRLACLIGYEGASDAELARARRLLEGLERDLRVEGGGALVSLLRRNLTLTQHLRAQRRQALEYRRKIEQLKGLERELEPAPTETSP